MTRTRNRRGTALTLTVPISDCIKKSDTSIVNRLKVESTCLYVLHAESRVDQSPCVQPYIYARGMMMCHEETAGGARGWLPLRAARWRRMLLSIAVKNLGVVGGGGGRRGWMGEGGEGGLGVCRPLDSGRCGRAKSLCDYRRSDSQRDSKLPAAPATRATSASAAAAAPPAAAAASAPAAGAGAPAAPRARCGSACC